MIETSPSTALELLALGDSIVVATLDAPKRTAGGIIIPDFSLHRRDEEYVATGLDFIESVTGEDMDEAREHMSSGFWDVKSRKILPFTLAVVIGESHDLGYMHNPPRFGDVLLIRQMASVEYHSMHKLGVGSTGTNGMLLQNAQGDRHVAVSGDSVVLSTPIEDVVVILARHEELEKWRKS